MTGSEIRKEFLEYFRSRGHAVLPSSSLVPEGDPTLLFTNAGMVQFKRLFLGEEKRDFKRATTSQKCMRAGGKHNDFENVGRTLRHHTFFEMLGNFSFGDYFKSDALIYAWELVTSHFGINPRDIWITIFRDDDEAYELWKKTGIDPKRIVRMGEEHNFWAMGETGPCGPCSEIIVDQGSELGCGKSTCGVGCDCDRFLELWNLVFVQFERTQDGRLVPLPNPSIDTGMGLERTAAVLQGVRSNYESDLFAGIIKSVEELSGREYGDSEDSDVAIRVLADHIRAMVFLIGDGVVPSNEGRGYVLRRIIRRAVRFGKKLNIDPPFLKGLTGAVETSLGEQYPEIVKRREIIDSIINSEEVKFAETLEKGIQIFVEELKSLKEKKIPGELAFKLYDTYGFPVDITEDMARESGYSFDRTGFEESLNIQRERSRLAIKQVDEGMRRLYAELLEGGIDVKFVGYDTLEVEARILQMLMEGVRTEECRAGDEVEIITDATPFYGESGGQVGDTGFISSNNFNGRVIDTLRPHPNLIIHRCKIMKGKVGTGEKAVLRVDAERRADIAANHTSTHLLHASLRAVLGEHLRQSGSMVAPERLRFDFSHYKQLTREEVLAIEDLVNRKILEDMDVKTRILPYNDAIAEGALAFFGEKYGEKVRLVQIGDFSRELCGGTHVKRTGNIGILKIISEESISAGVRRIEAVTGRHAMNYLRRMENQLAEISAALQTSTDGIIDRIRRLNSEIKSLEKEKNSLRAKLADRSAVITDSVRQINGINALVRVVNDMDEEAMLELGDRLKSSIKTGLLFIFSKVDEKVLLLSIVTDDLQDRFHAGDWMKAVAHLLGGKGGGRRGLARGSGTKIDRVDDAVKEAYRWVQERAGDAR